MYPISLNALMQLLLNYDLQTIKVDQYDSWLQRALTIYKDTSKMETSFKEMGRNCLVRMYKLIDPQAQLQPNAIKDILTKKLKETKKKKQDTNESQVQVET